MQRKASNSNKKHQEEFQKVLDEIYAETLQKSLSLDQKSRAKYQCNAKLAELIKKANILPYSFDFDWKVEKAEHGFEVAFERFKKMFFELSVEEQFALVEVDFGKNYVSYPAAVSRKLKKGDEFRFCLRVLDSSQEVIKIRKFFKNAIAQFKVAQEPEIKNLISEEENIYDAFNKLYSDIEPLYKFIACWKVAEYYSDEFRLMSEKHRNGVMLYLTARYIQLGKAAELGIRDKEASAYIEKWKSLFIIQDWTTDYAERLTVILDFLANCALSLDSHITGVYLFVVREGDVKVEISDYADALQGINISRLRICEYCKKLFWANRSDTYACSLKHARNRRMKLLRENWKNSGHLYLEARKKKSKKKENKNGSL